ncbi:hypothetical protein AGR6A_pAt20026 [Agrobacterium sp. NCPPB 925]|nr:hypothetical protein AGR6A_pAt20026 [Agrobacterium sp. NCPPB 925]
MTVAAKAIETKASFGHTRSIEVCVGVASPNRIAHDMPREQSVSSHQRAAGTIAIGTCSPYVMAEVPPFRSTPSRIGGFALPPVR